MKKNLLRAAIVAALGCLCMAAYAVPAKPGRHQYVQPDGSVITVVVHGDEWFHYTTDEMGNILETDEKGFMVKSASATLESIESKMTMARLKSNVEATRRKMVMKASGRTSGSPKIPVLLVQFSDKSFKITNPKQAFTDLLMKKGYNSNGGTGSVSDYYYDQSRGAYTPEFVVMDVVTLSGTMSTYGSTDEYAAKAIYEACQKLDSTVDFSQFDNDGDGKVDMILMYYAGYNEAEGGPSTTIWPHQFYVPYVVSGAKAFDGVYLDRYFCTSELKGASGTNMCGIGTTCHEFAHSLGLPDFYDTNYNNYNDGSAGATYAYDVMCSGSYNNNGCTPPWMNAEELIMLGWMDSLTEVPASGNLTIPSISSATPVAYRSTTSDPGEYFLYESRPGTVWDQPLTPGLLVYHVDKSSNRKVSFKSSSTYTRSVTPYELWADWDTYNAINCSGSHPCFYIVPSGNQTSLNYGGSNFTFPGGGKVTAYNPVDWSGETVSPTLANISFDTATKSVSLTLINANVSMVSGTVTDSKGQPIEGAVVTVTPVPYNDDIPAEKIFTDASGKYELELAESGTYMVQAAMKGYQSKAVTIAVTKPVIQDFMLLAAGEQLSNELYIYPDNSEFGLYGSSTSSSWTQMAANCYEASAMAPYAGRQIKSVSFIVGGETNTRGTVYALIDVGSSRKVFSRVSSVKVNDWTTVDVSSSKVVVEAGKDIYAGYALSSWRNGYPFAAVTGDGGYMSAYSSTSSSWSGQGIIFAVKIELLPDPDAVSGAGNGRCSIEDLCNGIYSVGEEFDLALTDTTSDTRPGPGGVTWLYDGEIVTSTSIFLKESGRHTVTARYTSVSGSEIILEQELFVR